MKLFKRQQQIIAFITGIFAVVFGAQLVFNIFGNESGHPIGYSDNENEVHVHSDFVLYLNGSEIDLTADKYQSRLGQVLHEDIHLHDNNDEVIHRHDHGITLSYFFASLGFTLTNNSVVSDTQQLFQSDSRNQLMVFVNDKKINEPSSYISQEEDRILVYFGNPSDNEKISELLASISDKACIYSGTCPERGTPPPEACGLTCEI